MQDSLVLNVVVAFDTDYYIPWGFGEVITGQKAQGELKDFLEEHKLPWSSTGYDPATTFLEIRYYDPCGEGYDHYFGLCPVKGETPTLLCGHRRREPDDPCWEIRVDGELVFNSDLEEDSEASVPAEQ